MLLGLFCPLKTSENIRFSNVFIGYRERPVACNRLRKRFDTYRFTQVVKRIYSLVNKLAENLNSKINNSYSWLSHFLEGLHLSFIYDYDSKGNIVFDRFTMKHFKTYPAIIIKKKAVINELVTISRGLLG